ncbi:cell adhesion molecule CEACAM1-like [Pempheris klunzingeri]|uniref:cell adhesion molecule CEACAM1-like n=1 Tax=Pempheris klunzingeri TaxID=3127111 RepID=UPI00397F5F32
MCSTSCPLTENPAAYIWYKNRQFLYQDWSPWYQQLVSSEEAATYSCAIRGREDLTAPEVSVDSVTSSCFSVTYAKGRMCSYKQKSEDEPCSITYPTELHVQRSNGNNFVTLTCHTSCPLIDSQTAFSWYQGGYLQAYTVSAVFFTYQPSDESFSCAVKDHKDLLSVEVCRDDKSCWRVNYVRRRICALEGSSVNISSEYLHPENQQPKNTFWYKVKRSSEDGDEELIEAAGRVEYHDNMKNHHILRIGNVKKNDSGEYKFSLQEEDKGRRDSLGVILMVTGLKVKFTPSSVVTEGQRVTVTCSTSCPLPHNTNYIWYLNGRPLNLQETQNKHLVLDPVGSQHAGNYICAVKTHNISSCEKSLTVQSKAVKWTAAAAAAAGGVALLLVIIPLAVFLWISRRKRTSSQSPTTETSGNVEQLNLGTAHDELSDQPREQDDLHYSRVHFTKNQTDPLYSTVPPQQSKQQEDVHYAVVNLRQNTSPE